MILYGAHPMDSRAEFRQLELRWESKYDIEIINPFYDINRDDIKAYDEGYRGRYESNSGDVVFRDVNAIGRARDGLIAYLPPDCLIIGTYMEIVYANMLNRDVYTICTNGHHNHPWIKEHSYDLFTSTEEFEEWLEIT